MIKLGIQVKLISNKYEAHYHHIGWTSMCVLDTLAFKTIQGQNTFADNPIFWIEDTVYLGYNVPVYSDTALENKEVWHVVWLRPLYT